MSTLQRLYARVGYMADYREKITQRLGGGIFGVFFVCLMLLAMSGCGSVEGAVLEGYISDSEGGAIAGLEVRIGSFSALTDAEGFFRIEGLTAGSASAELIGDQGTGRINLNLEDGVNAVNFDYPVVTRVILLHDNDLHFSYEYAGLFESLVQSFRDEFENVFLLSSGDIFVWRRDSWAVPGCIEHYRERAFFMMDMMNRAGYDALTPGNHELYYYEHHTGEALAAAGFPLLVANIKLETDRLPVMKPYHIFETENGLKIAVLGLSVAWKRGGVESLDPVRTALEYRRLSDENDVLVALAHIGRSSERELARGMPEIDVIIGGHTHRLLERGEIINGVLIGVAGGHSHQDYYSEEDPQRHLGKIEVVLENDRVVDKRARVMSLHEFPISARANPVSMNEVELTIENIHPILSVEVDVTGGYAGGPVEFRPENRFIPPESKILLKHDLETEIIGIPELKYTVSWEGGAREIILKESVLSEVGYADFPVRVDGDLSEWDEFPSISIENGEGIRADLHLARDEKNIYIAVSVDDPEHFNTRRGAEIWDGDSLQFAVDPLSGAEPFNLGVALASGEARSYQWRGPEPNPFEGGEYAVVRDEEGQRTYYEIKIPLEALHITGEEGSMFGFNAVVFDDRDGEGFDSLIEITPGIARGWDPGAFNRFIFRD